MTLTEFLLARIAEDEAAAERGGRHNGVGTYANDNYGCLLVDPARVLAECEAKRRIVEACADATHDAFAADYDLAPRYDLGWDVLCALALPHADHPDYDEEWRLADGDHHPRCTGRHETVMGETVCVLPPTDTP